MNHRFTMKLFHDFPLLYADKNQPMDKSLLCFGICCDDGWVEIIYALSKKLETMIKLPGNGDCRAIQVKEKFGTLRFYMTSSTPQMEKEINKAAALSAKTCEICGKPGKIASETPQTGWFKTLCDKHRKTLGFYWFKGRV